MVDVMTQAERSDDFKIERLAVFDPVCLQDKTVPQRSWIWSDWIPINTTSSLYGDGGAGKTLLAQQLATACATGQPFLSMPVMKCRVFGVFCEDDSDELHRRQASINAAMGIDFADLENLQWVSRVGDDNLLNTFTADGRSVRTPFANQVYQAASDFGAQLIIIDTAADTFGGNENIRGHVRQYIAQLTRMALGRNGAVLLLAHPSATGRSSGNGDGGSTAWNNSVRSRIYIKRQEMVNGETPDPDIRILSRMKANYAAANVDLTLRYKSGAFDLEGLQAGDDPSTFDRSQAADTAFLTGMGELNQQKMRVNIHRGQANYAPKSLREKTDCCSSFSEKELAAAMNRLIRSKRIASVEEGPPSRRRSFLAVVSPPIPGL